MTHRNWSRSVHHWHPPHPRVPRLPRLHLSSSQVAALRQGVIVALCALLAGSLTCHWSTANRGAILPSPSAAAGGA